MSHEDAVNDLKHRIASADTIDIIHQLYGEWATLVETPQQHLDYCESRLQYLEADLASMDESAFLIHGSQVKGEIAWL